MSDRDIFQNSDNPNPPDNGRNGSQGENPNPNGALVDLLSAITNEEGKPKYDSVEKAIEALKHSQDHIRRLEDERRKQDEELQRMREEDATRESVEQVVNRLLAAKESNKPPVQDTPQQSGGGVDENAVVEVVKRVLEVERLANSETTNHQMVQASLIAKFGDKTVEVINAKAQELGTTAEELGALAKKNPKMVLSLFNATTVKPVGPTTGSINLPLTPENKEPERPKLEKSILQGATMRDQMDAFARSKAYTNKRLGITE